MVALIETDHSELHDALIRLGEKPDESGSFKATVYKTVIGVRAAATGLGTNALPSFVMGEERVVDEYNKAIEEYSFDHAIVETLKRQRENLLGKIAEMKKLAT